MYVTSRTKLAVLLVVVALAVMLVAPATTQAQDVATGSATATVQAILAVTATKALVFGTVFQGVAKSVANDVADAGIFTIIGEADANVAIYMQLPDFISTATGDDRMVISFSTTDATADSTAAGDPTDAGILGWLDVDPHNFPAATAIGGTGPGTSVYLGGTVTPSVDQAAGAYTGDIILTVAYTGT